jgi:hypothetical protein
MFVVLSKDLARNVGKGKRCQTKNSGPGVSPPVVYIVAVVSKQRFSGWNCGSLIDWNLLLHSLKQILVATSSHAVIAILRAG